MLQTVILAGGLGTRLRQETEFKPKPMVEIADRPILWHLMMNLNAFGVNDYVICTGYKGNVIKDYFLNFYSYSSDIQISLNDTYSMNSIKKNHNPDWNICISDTGALTNTGGRLKQIQRYISDERFLCVYGDGLADVNIDELLEFHLKHGRLATVTVARPLSRFGVADIAENGQVRSFLEKPQLEGWVNIGFFVFEKEFFNYLDDDCILEQGPLRKLALEGQLMAFKHEGFWQPMDTYREMLILNELWQNDSAPWKNWN
jgi:glucose-1-phosphate cytidylyltransferase